MVFLKKILTVIVTLMLTVSIATTAMAQATPVYGEMAEEATQIYAETKKLSGRRSFNGYCGAYVRYQLRAMGIFEGKYDASGNGNKWYGAFENISRTSGGYYVYRESGNDCLEKLAEKYGNNLKNIVLSFPIQSGYSASYPGAGHALVIRYLIDGVAYYSESFSYGGLAEGQMVKEDASELIARYNRRHGTALGCVYFSDKDETYNEEEALRAEITAEIVAEIKNMNNFVECAEEFMKKTIADI